MLALFKLAALACVAKKKYSFGEEIAKKEYLDDHQKKKKNFTHFSADDDKKKSF